MSGSPQRTILAAGARAEVGDLGGTIARLVGHTVPRLADWCVATLVGDDPARGAAHRDPDRVAAVDAYAEAAADPRCREAPLWTVLATGAPLHLPRASPAALDLACPDPHARALLGRLAPTSGMAVPLAAHGRPLGVLELWNTGSRPPHTADEIGTTLELGRRAGLVIDTALLGAHRPPAPRGARDPVPVRAPGVTIATRYRPVDSAARVGGRWSDVFPTADGSTCLVIGDVAGRDPAAAATMDQVRDLLRGIGYTLGGVPGPLLTALDRAMAGLGVRSLTSAVLATVAPAGTGDPPGSQRLRWSNAGHPPPLLLHPGGRVEILDATADLLLGLDPRSRRDGHERVLAPGATVLLYTDGLVERGDAINWPGLRRLVRLAAGAAGLTLDGCCDALLELAADADDDVALLALRTGTGAT